MAQDKDQKTLNVPPLRFTGFTGDWKKTTLGEIGKTFNGLTGKNSNDFGQGSPYITYKSIFDNSKVDISRVEYVTITDNERIKSAQNVVRLGDIFFTTSSETPTEVGMTSVLLDGIEDCYLNSFCFGYRLSNKEETLPEYFRFYLRASVIRNKLSILAQGSTRFNISKNEVMRMGINLPNSSEQEKIAALLSCIDERITTQNKIIEKLESLIKGLNDSLYKRYGDSIRTTFAKLGYSYSGLSGKSAEDFGTGKPFIPYLNVYSNNIVNENDYQYVRINDGEKQNIVQYGDVLFTLSSETPEEVGVGSVYLGIDEVFLNSFCFGFHIENKELAYPPYFSYYVSSTPFRKFIYPFAQGSTRFNLCKADFEKTSIKLPSLENQKHIYAILNRITEKIETEKSLLEHYTTQKQYLLHQMFI